MLSRRRRRRPVTESASIRPATVIARTIPVVLLLVLLLHQLVFALPVKYDRLGRAVQIDVHRVQCPRESGRVRLRHG